ncbi:MAG: hypothetical protein V3U35_00410 [Candidatus Neomarinimicrobiota bacterium]
MASRTAQLLAIFTMSLTPLFGSHVEAANKLSPDGKKVVDYLVKDWDKRFRSTSIPLAMSNLGIAPEDNLRLEIIGHFRDNPRIARNVRYWGANNYLLTPDERLIAKYLLNTRRDEDRQPGPAELGGQVGLDEAELQERLAFMARAGFLTPAADEELGYALAEGAEMWGGPLRHNFHTVTVEGEEPFEIW